MRKSSSTSSSSSSPSRRKRRGKQQKVKEAQKLLEKHDPWKEEANKKERAVELQEQSEVLAKVMKEQFDQTMNALSPSIITPPPFPFSLPSVPSLPLAGEKRRGQYDLLGALQLRWIDAALLHKASSSGTAGSWRPWASSWRRGQAWCLTLHANNELSCPPLQVFGRPWAWSWYVWVLHVSLGTILGI